MPKGRVNRSIWTPANIVTVIRIAALPLWLLLAQLSVPATNSVSISSLVIFVLYVLISLTDKLDGYLARSRNEVSSFGKFLDPIADKLAVTVALCYLLESGLTNSWVLLVILSREFLVSGLRMVVASKGVVVAASNLGKWKTAITMASICGLLLVMALPQGVFADRLHLASNVGMAIALVLTAWSGVDYFMKCWPYVIGKRR